MKVLQTAIVLSLILGTTACASTRRSVTHVRVEKDNAYIAYAEWDQGWLVFGDNRRSRVKHCEILPDNSLKCEEDEDINYVLNPQEGGKPPPKKAKSPEEPPAEESEEDAAEEEGAEDAAEEEGAEDATDEEAPAAES